jgi:hypothetical protein
MKKLCRNFGFLIVVALGACPAIGQVKVEVFTSNLIDATLGTATLTQLPTPPCGTDCGTPTFVYHKLHDDTVLKITYTDTVANTGPGASTCQYQLRVDGAPSSSSDNAPAPYLTGSNIANTTLSSTGIFSDLPRGSHTLSIWHRQISATTCIRNSGGFTTTVVVEELKSHGESDDSDRDRNEAKLLGTKPEPKNDAVKKPTKAA